MIKEDKVSLARERAELVARLAGALSAEDRVRVQGELSVINAQIKALNTTQAAQLKAAADQRKIAGLAEAQANAARARTKVGGALPHVGGALPQDVPEEDGDPGQPDATDAWVDAVLLRHDIDFTRARDGKIMLDVPPRWAAVIGMLVAGIYAAAAGQALPELPSEEPKPRSKPKPKKR